MKVIIGLMIFLAQANLTLAQEVNAEQTEREIRNVNVNEPKVTMLVEETLYPKVYPAPNDNGYWSEDGKAFLHAEYRNLPYEKFKKFLNTEISGVKIIESKEITLEGIPFLYQKTEMDRDGEIVEIVNYIKANTGNSVIQIGGHFLKGNDEIYQLAIEKAAVSAKIIKK